DLVLGIGIRPGTEAARALPDECGGELVPLMAGDEPGAAIPSMASLAATLRALAEGARRRSGSGARAACARANQSLQEGLAEEMQHFAATRPWHVGLAIQALAARLTPDHVRGSGVSNVKPWMPLQLPGVRPGS